MNTISKIKSTKTDRHNAAIAEAMTWADQTRARLAHQPCALAIALVGDSYNAFYRKDGRNETVTVLWAASGYPIFEAVQEVK